ncbi:hypothetical protein [Crateriforma conspicua]|uniref:Uncharacterized protein n=1 Tax=Crateriforma conspicua TaxID=2527996 RepID=A0A5C6FVR7_9PLAN|nr:hypothetical protein [Crateriforma conspicua]TWU66446.1 hypothetical protein V7x_20120 [Crateriforma conspicua]
MSLIIATQAFDLYQGEIRLPAARTVVYTPNDKAETGVQLFPGRSSVSEIQTTLFVPESLRQSASDALVAMTGNRVPVYRDGLNYFVNYGLLFVIEQVVPESIDVMASVYSHRNGSDVLLAPAGRVVTNWRLRAVPA